jgi:hypothetical protein
MEAPEVPEALTSLLANMSPRTRRPIRFVAPENTHPSGLVQDSALQSGDSDDRSRPPRPLTAVK